MGTKVQIDNYLAGHCSMRDLSRESNGTSWPSCFGDSNLSNGQFYYGFLPRTVEDSHSGYDKDVVKQTILEHEAIFKNQVCELHRLYRVQRDLMDEARRKEQLERQIPYETSSSSSPVQYQMKSDNVQRWNGSSLPLENSVCGRPTSGPATAQTSPHSAKGKSMKAGHSPFQSCYSPKNSEVSDSRPTKLRRMFDLQLPADEYIDTDEVEQFGSVKVSDNISPSPDKNGKVAPKNGKLSLNYAGKTECCGDASRSGSDAGKSKALADLNEPVHVEETTAISSADFLSRAGFHNDFKYRDLSINSLSSSKDVARNSIRGSLNGMSKNYQLENRPSSQDIFCYALESEQQKGSSKYINQGIHPEMGDVPFQPVKLLFDQPSQHPAFLTGDNFRGDSWKAKPGVNVEKSDQGYPMSNYNMTEQVMASPHPNQPSFFHRADLGMSRDQCASSWGQSSCVSSHKSMTVQKVPFLTSANLSKSPQSSAPSNGLFSNKWNLNCSPGTNAIFDSEPYMKYGFYGSTVASYTELPVHVPPVGFDSGKSVYKFTPSIDVKPVKDVNLNVALPNDALHDHKSEDTLAILPWLRGKSACSDKAETSSKCPKPLVDSFVRRGPSLASTSHEGNANANKKPDSSDCPSSRKILGVPIFETSPTLKKENTALISPSTIDWSAKEETGTCGRKLVFDMNLPCELSDSEGDNKGMEEEPGFVEKKMKTESASLRNHFDLNSCITDEEIPCIIPLPDSSTKRKGDTGIDLEAPVVLEDEEAVLLGEDSTSKEPGKLPELPPADDGEAGIAKSAAEAIIAISSSVNLIQSGEEVIRVPEGADVDDPLIWFVDIACSSGKDNSDCLPKEIDDFESMTLGLKACTSEEYFPKPSVPEFLNIEESSKRILTTRTRKGQGRRGRQRRDFQRDILPGLASLSRHEVTEDMQTFGGLMRATGYAWQCGPNRRNITRNGCGRGRRRGVAAAVAAPVHTVAAALVQQQQQLQMNSNNTEVGLEDRSLTGWGKTTRRPRRQRLPAGNLTPPVPLSL